MTVGRTAEIISFMIILLSIALCIGATIWLIPLSYKYAFAYYELAMSPGMSPKDIVELSGRKMIGNRWKYFKLTLSFIGWYLLACLGLGIPLFWITPYMTIASVFFYVWVSQEYQNNGTINY
jgi:uncharacterized membrane protein